MLVIIDIQEYYDKDFRDQKEKFEEMMTRIRKRIILAKETNEIIINLTHFRDGSTKRKLQDLLSGYSNAFNISKNQEDGSRFICRFIKDRKLSPRFIELCGIFRNVCVLETWKGLKELGLPVTSVDEDLTLTTDWLKIKEYPEGFSR